MLGHLPKRLLFAMIKNADFNGSVDTNPYKLRHYDISEYSLYVNGKHVASDGLTVNMITKRCLLSSIRLFLKGCRIHHWNSGLQITHMYINGYFMLLFDLTLSLKHV